MELATGCVALLILGIAYQTASEHYLPPWGMKPTVLDPRNPLDFHTLTRMH
jgi:hypothetical protein